MAGAPAHGMLVNEVKAGEQTVYSSGRTPLTIPEVEQTQKEAVSSSFYTTSTAA